MTERTVTVELEMTVLRESEWLDAEVSYEVTPAEYMAGAGWGRQVVDAAVRITRIEVQIGNQWVDLLPGFDKRKVERMQEDLLREEVYG